MPNQGEGIAVDARGMGRGIAIDADGMRAGSPWMPAARGGGSPWMPAARGGESPWMPAPRGEVRCRCRRRGERFAVDAGAEGRGSRSMLAPRKTKIKKLFY